MNIPIHLLQTLVVFSQELTLEKTAKKLQTTQPTATRQLQQLQSFLQSALFETSGRQKKLTQFGLQLAYKLSARFSDLENIIQEVALEAGLEREVHILVGGRSEVLARIFGLISTPVSVELVPQSSDETRRSLLSLSVDMTVTKEDVVTSNYIKKKLFSDKWMIAVPEPFLRKEKEIKTWSRVAHQYPFCAYKKNFSEVQDNLQREGFQLPKDDFVFADWKIIERRVEKGLGWAVMPSSFIQEKTKYVSMELSGIPSQDFYLYYKKSLSRFGWFRELLQQIQSSRLT